MLPDHCSKIALISFHSQNMVGQDVSSNLVVFFISLLWFCIFFVHFRCNFFFIFKNNQFQYSFENKWGENMAIYSSSKACSYGFDISNRHLSSEYTRR